MHVYDYLVRVPLVIRWLHRLPSGVMNQHMVRLPDILPTVLDLIGICSSQSSDIDGRSFKALIESKPWKPLPAYLSVTGGPPELEIRGVRTERYKYTFSPENPSLPQELYDLSCDPQERCNLSADKQELCMRLRNLANDFIPAEGGIIAEQIRQDAAQERQIKEHLKNLGYIDDF